MTPELVLASASAARKAVLEAAGIPHRAVDSGVDEARVKSRMVGENPAAIARTLASAKAVAVSNSHPGSYVLGADQTLNCAGRLFDKPTSLAEAREQLVALRGKTHRLETAAAIVCDGTEIWSCQRHATLVMRNFTDGFLDAYLADSGTGLATSVGGYKIESTGMQLFSAVDGNHFVILGLPLVDLCAELRRLGILAS